MHIYPCIHVFHVKSSNAIHKLSAGISAGQRRNAPGARRPKDASAEKKNEHRRYREVLLIDVATYVLDVRTYGFFFLK